MKNAPRLAATLLLSLLFSSLSYPQQAVQTGTPPLGSFGGGPFDIVNLGNSNVHFTLPVFNKAGRGVPFTYNFQYDTSIWYPLTISGTTTWAPVQNWGLIAQTASTTGYISVQVSTYTCYTYISLNHTYVLTGQTTSYNWNFYIDPAGVQHWFNALSTVNWGSCNGVQYPPSQNITATTTDGSGYVLKTAATGQTTSSASITTREGTVTYPPWNANGGTANYTDRNGNQLTIDASGHFYDTMSSSTPVLTVAGSGTPSSPMTFSYTAPSGATPSFKLNYTNYTIATNFGISSIHEYKSSGPVALVTSAVLTDGSQYTFNYETTPSIPSAGACTPYSGTTCVTARLISVTLPTGGQITYGYSGSNNGIYSDGTVPTLNRTTPDGIWQYVRTQISGNHWQTKATSPNDPSNTGSVGNDTVIDFQKDSGGTANFYETYRQVFQGSSSSGTLLFATTTCYNNNTSNCSTTAVTSPITQRRTNPQFGGTSTQSFQSVNYNTYGLPTEQDDYL